jgi:hypothetical protein
VVQCPAIRHFGGVFRWFSDILGSVQGGKQESELPYDLVLAFVCGDKALDLQSEVSIVIVEAAHEACYGGH